MRSPRWGCSFAQSVWRDSPGAEELADLHGAEAPSEWVVRWAQLVTRGPVLDVASGAGRHARFFSGRGLAVVKETRIDRKSTRLNSSHVRISYAVFCLHKKNNVTIVY